MTNIFALTTRGLETISAAEMSDLPGITVSAVAYRRVSATCADSLSPLLGLRTVDDIYLDLGSWTGIGHTRDMLAALQWYATQLDLEAAAISLSALRPLPPQPIFSITASFVGKRNFSSDEIKHTVSEGIRSGFDWRYTPDDREADLNVRVFIDHETAYVGLRLATHPLHERSYKVVQRVGSLKPSVAAAMLRLAELQPGQRLLDPCCGAGTILIEAAQIGAIALGGDLDTQAVEAARLNAQAAELRLPLACWDARTLPLPAHSADLIVTNLPWGRQVALNDEADFYQPSVQEIERVLAQGGQVVTLTNTPELLRFAVLQPVLSLEISLFGQTPTISLFQ